MIKVKLIDVIRSLDGLAEVQEKELPGKLSYNLGRIITAAQREVEQYNTFREQVIKKYCVKDENGQLKTTEDGTNYIVMEGKEEEAQEELTSILEEEIELNANPLDLEVLEKYDFKPKTMSMIMPYIKNDEE